VITTRYFKLYRKPKRPYRKTDDALFPSQSGTLGINCRHRVRRRQAESRVWRALVASLPLISIMAIIWLWRDTGDGTRVASQMEATFWYVLPSLPMFLLMPAMLRGGIGFWPSLIGGCVLTFVLYLITASILARFGIQL
jgi:hypothetical protein